jgi:geranylgeranyl pyrophosphate synthase
MELYKQITEYIAGLQGVSAWPELQGIFQKAVSGRPKHWMIPGLACEALGGTMEKAIPAIAAIACLHISIILIDDMLDDDPRGEHLRIGLPATANLAAAFQSLGLEAIHRSGLAPQPKLSVLESLNAMIRKTAFGQYLDTLNLTDESTYWQIIQTKSSPFFGAALQAGGLFGGASIEVGEQLTRLGCMYGECIQMHDDLNDSLAVPANSDWLGNRAPLPILFAQVVNHPDRERFLALRREINDPKKLTEAQAILVRCGAVSYCLDRILAKQKEALSLLKEIPLANKTILEKLFAELVLPIQSLLKAVNPAQPSSLSSF